MDQLGMWCRLRALGHGYVVVAGALLILVCGCAKQQIWYQQGKGQADYDRAAQECAIIAGNFARQATVTGNSEDPSTYHQTLRNCLSAKGWSATPLGSKDASRGAAGTSLEPPLMVIEGSTLSTLGSVITLPSSFSVSGSADHGSGPARGQTVTFAGPQATFVTIMAQKVDAKANRFVATPYPVTAPFFLYEHGGAEQGDGHTGRQRAIFCGAINGEWVMGLGSYLLISERERITVIVTKSMRAQQTEPDAGFRLSREQFAMVDAFEKEWTQWLASDVALPRKPWWSRIVFSR